MRFLTAAIVVAGLIGGCSEHGHDHDHAHDHDSDGHHVHTAPHGGTLIVLGNEQVHLELVLEKSGKLTVWVLDGEAEKSIRIEQPALMLEFESNGRITSHALVASANPLTGETVGDTSEFSATIPTLAGATKFEATIKMVDARGKVFDNVAIQYPEGNE